jgi:hypothetical protein
VGRGLGTLQRWITGELARQPTKHLPWDKLKRRSPKEVEQRTFFRAIRGWRRQGLVYDERGGARHYLALTVLSDDELLDLCSATFAMLDAATRACDVLVPPITEPVPAPERSGVLAVGGRMWALRLLPAHQVIK